MVGWLVFFFGESCEVFLVGCPVGGMKAKGITSFKIEHCYTQNLCTGKTKCALCVKAKIYCWRTEILTV